LKLNQQEAFVCCLRPIFHNFFSLHLIWVSSFAGLAAGVHSGLTYGLTEVRGAHDWRNSAVAGAITGAAVALTSDRASHEQVVQCAIAGAALSTAANVLSGIF
jgi:hypothetical protein